MILVLKKRTRKVNLLMTELKNNSFSDVMLNRHTVHKFDPDVKISRNEIKEIIKQAATAPSSCNLQSWKFVAVDDEEGRKKMHEYFFPNNFTQVDTASVIIQVFGNTLAYQKAANAVDKQVTAGKLTEDQGKKAKFYVPIYSKLNEPVLNHMTTIDATLAAMQLILAARAHGYETNPMSGYDASKAATALGLDPKQYVPILAVAIGKPADDARIVKTPRYDVDEILDFE